MHVTTGLEISAEDLTQLPIFIKSKRHCQPDFVTIAPREWNAGRHGKSAVGETGSHLAPQKLGSRRSSHIARKSSRYTRTASHKIGHRGRNRIPMLASVHTPDHLLHETEVICSRSAPASRSIPLLTSYDSGNPDPYSDATQSRISKPAASIA
jgi:hypothetical protein